MDNETKTILVAVVIILVALVSFNLSDLTGKVTSDVVKEQSPKIEPKVITNIKYQCLDGSFVDKQYECPTDQVQNPSGSSSDSECNYNKYNCADFSSYTKAKAMYDKCGGVNNDVHHLDGDSDGIPCEALR